MASWVLCWSSDFSNRTIVDKLDPNGLWASVKPDVHVGDELLMVNQAHIGASNIDQVLQRIANAGRPLK